MTLTAKAIIWKIRTLDQKELLLTNTEAENLYDTAKKQNKTNGNYAEAGVYKGATAKIISKAKGKKTLLLFDTFEGLPKPQKIDTKQSGKPFKEKEFVETLENVQHYLRKETNIKYHKGLLKDTLPTIPKQQYAFVHLDLDLYESTKQALRYFYPRMATRGIILSHDYTTITSVKKAFDEYFKNKPEKPTKVSFTTQCKVVKT